ncbi:hypothetical protein NQ317_001875 [Molorchus minor]|uniref:Uncharacterized protein n=1 Tax=Molorchus minor TaxID=1323400 RepID=A0ABQ9J5J6_9CUCU|nr:hypothetical protein NQ317_001875 [Molorchus minor]
MTYSSYIEGDQRQLTPSHQVYHTTMKYATCPSCVGNVTSYINFETTCEGTEEKIHLYQEIQRDEDIIKLNNVLTFLGQGICYNNKNMKEEGIDVKEEVKLLDSDEM